MNKPIPSQEELAALLEPLDAAPVECDGMARLIATVLRHERIPFRVMVGSLAADGQGIAPHVWIEVGQWRIDYRARMWLRGLSDVPHGVFPLESGESTRYNGMEAEIEPLEPWMFKVLTMPQIAEMKHLPPEEEAHDF
ncbi:hypothetical protein [Pseudomonas sp. 2FE]|uniref:hypothetical protein n=1 Tax=Pseudomonas sp. 2FE TaxID=2502190 RepID=UPI0010F8B2A9|nr:hypothetical protein [Pseudomonas sp. 2FE]